MFKLLSAPQSGKIGRLLISQTVEVAHIEGMISRMGFRPAKHHEINHTDVAESPHILVAIGEKVPHPESQKPSFKAFCRKDGLVHILSDHALQPNIEVALC
jgi:hypothetical protein